MRTLIRKSRKIGAKSASLFAIDALRKVGEEANRGKALNLLNLFRDIVNKCNIIVSSSISNAFLIDQRESERIFYGPAKK